MYALPDPRILDAEVGQPGDWRSNKEAFAQKFGLTYEDFVEIVSSMSPEKMHEYEGIRLKNEKAAILWAIDEAKKHG